jgi:hypothetical protein
MSRRWVTQAMNLAKEGSGALIYYSGFISSHVWLSHQGKFFS